MTKASSIIRQSLGKIGIVSPGEPVNPDDAADCLIHLNTMLDGHRAESLYAYCTQRVTGALPASTQTRTIGPTGQLAATPRPIRLEAGSFYTAGGIDYPIRSITEAESNSIGLKATDGLGPDVVFYSPALPNGTLYFWPRASAAVTLTLVVMQQLTAFANLNTDYTLPPGYENMLVLSFAEYAGTLYEREIPPTLAKQAAAARRNIKRANQVVPQLDVLPTRPWGPGAILLG